MTDLPSLKSLKGYQWHFRNMGFVTLESILLSHFPLDIPLLKARRIDFDKRCFRYIHTLQTSSSLFLSFSPRRPGVRGVSSLRLQTPLRGEFPCFKRTRSRLRSHDREESPRPALPAGQFVRQRVLVAANARSRRSQRASGGSFRAEWLRGAAETANRELLLQKRNVLLFPFKLSQTQIHSNWSRIL